MADCKHCGKTIRYGSATGWVHVDSRSVFCGGDAKRIAEPKRIRQPYV